MDWCGIGQVGDGWAFDNFFGEDHALFLSGRSSSKPTSFGSRENALRGVRSGVRRKTNAIINRTKSGAPIDRASRQQDKRAAKFLLAAFGAMYFGHDGTFKTLWHAGGKLGTMVRIARAIWLKESMRQFMAGEKISLDEMFEANIFRATKEIREFSVGCDFTDFEIECFDQVSSIINYILCAKLSAYEESLYTPEDRKRMALYGTIPDPLGLRQEKANDLHTNHIYLSNEVSKPSLEDLILNVKSLIRSITYKKVGSVGWKSVCRVRARCFKMAESGTLDGLMGVRSVLERFEHGRACLGKRKRGSLGCRTPLSDRHINALAGLSESSGLFMSRQFDLAVYRAMI